jgi:hypothetical protein
MDGIERSLLTMPAVQVVSRRAALRGMGVAAVAALAIGLPERIRAHAQHGVESARFAPDSGDDPAAVLVSYVEAVNAGDLEAILALYDDDAFHIALPSPDGSAGVCAGKEQFRMWYEQSVANGDRIEVEEDTLAVNNNQATFVALLSSVPWQDLGVEALEATSEIVVIDGRIMTHVVLLTPDSVRQLQAARGAAASQGMGSASEMLISAPSSREVWAAPSERRMLGQPY